MSDQGNFSNFLVQVYLLMSHNYLLQHRQHAMYFPVYFWFSKQQIILRESSLLIPGTGAEEICS